MSDVSQIDAAGLKGVRLGLVAATTANLDDDTKAAFAAAIDKLKGAGVTPLQYRALDSLGIAKSMDVENLCSDLEFAIARAISLLRQPDDPKPDAGQLSLA